MEDEAGKSCDLISDLPVPIMHRILRLIPIEDAIRTSVLSKQWNSIQKCFPVLEFRQLRRRRQRGEFLEFVGRSLQNFVRNKLSPEIICFRIARFGDDSGFLVINTWLPLALHNGVSDLSFDGCYSCPRREMKTLHYPLPETTFSINSALFHGISESFNLLKLELSRVRLSDSMVRDIIQNCPNLTNLSFSDFIGVETLTIHKPLKLECLTVFVSNWTTDLQNLIVDALTLKRLSLNSGEFYIPFAMIDLTACSNLRELELRLSFINDYSFNLNISRFTLLESLDITSCDELTDIQISLHRLKHLNIYKCEVLEGIMIDAPILSEFVYTPEYGNLAQLVLPNEIPGSMYLTCCTNDLIYVNSFWFFQIRRYLTVPFKGIVFSFDDYLNPDFDPIEFCFDHADLREALNLPLVEVDCLNLSDLRVHHLFRWETLLDGLLWSCHPKMVRMKATTQIQFDETWIRIEVLCKMLNESECRLCRNLPRCHCWRHRMKAVKIKSVKGVEFHDLNFERIKDYYLSNPEDNEVQFVFDWDSFSTEESVVV